MSYSKKKFITLDSDIHLRLTSNQFNFVKSQADIFSISPSDYIRKLIDLDRVGGFDEYKKSDFNN